MGHEALTATGAGVRIGRAALEVPDPVAHLRSLLENHRFVVLDEALADARDAVDLLKRFGPLNEAATRTRGAVVVEDAGDSEVFRSASALPLHKDGILTGVDAQLVGIYCIAFREIVDGRTLVSDALAALDTLPAAHVELLRENGLEALALDATGYYQERFVERWQPFPAFRALPGRAPSWNIGLPHAPGEPESWRVRVANVPERLSDEILHGLRTELQRPELLYRHDWKEGDLLLMDNYAVLHGREAFRGAQRRLANIQVLVEAPAGPA